jgi:hypothetical protein
MKELLVIIFSFVFFSCQFMKTTNLSCSNELKMHFTASEIEELSGLLGFFDNQTKFQLEDDFFESLSKVEYGSELIAISKRYFNDQGIYAAFTPSLKEKVWVKQYAVEIEEPETRSFISLKYKGEYYKFLLEYAKMNGGIIKEYFEGFEIAGDLSPSMVSLVQKKWKDFDLQNDCHRLVIAIHYFTLANSEIVYRN